MSDYESPAEGDQKDPALEAPTLSPDELSWAEGHEEGYDKGRAYALAEVAEKLQRWIDWLRDGRELRRKDMQKLRDDLLS